MAPPNTQDKVGVLPRSVLSGLSAFNQRAGRTDQEIVLRLEQVTGTKGIPGLSLAAGLGPRAKIDPIQLEAKFIENGTVQAVHTGLDALQAKLTARDPVAEQTAAVIAKRIDYRPHVGPGGSFTYSYNAPELSKIGEALGLTAQEQTKLADIVRVIFPKDRPVTMDDSGRLGSAQELASQEAHEKLAIVLNPGSSIGGILAGFVGVAGGSAKDMRAAAQVGTMFEAAGMFANKPLTDATEAVTRTKRAPNEKIPDKVPQTFGPPPPANTNQVLQRPQRISGETLGQILKSAPRQGWGKDAGEGVVLNDKRPGSGLKADETHKMASYLSEEQLNSAAEFNIIGGDKKLRTLVQVPDIYFKGKNDTEWRKGVVEYVVDNGVVTHQRFVEGGVVTGSPNQKVSTKEVAKPSESAKGSAQSDSRAAAATPDTKSLKQQGDSRATAGQRGSGPPPTPPPKHNESRSATAAKSDTKSTVRQSDSKTTKSTP
jgi:hypothetical protein